ncbi:hypothetical protein ACLEPN_26825, partial [Myxococcus sp. 1LA]
SHNRSLGCFVVGGKHGARALAEARRAVSLYPYYDSHLTLARAPGDWRGTPARRPLSWRRGWRRWTSR